MSQPPPAYLALDLWMALDLPMDEFDGYYERNGWANTWGILLGHVRELAGRPQCWEPAGQGERCVLTLGTNGGPHIGPHMGASDVGTTEELPR